jgi:hypothetical protein
MDIHKTIVVMLALLLAGMAIVPMVSAEDNFSTDLSSQSTSQQKVPEVEFAGISGDLQTTFPEKTGSLTISDSIKKYDLISMDAKKLKEQLLTNQKIPVRIKGTNYFMNLHEDTFYPSDETGVYTFSGYLENSIDGARVTDSEVHLTLDDSGVIGKISPDQFSYWYIDLIETSDISKSSGPIQYVYYSGNVEQKISPMGEDRYVMLPSGESKPLNELSKEELTQYLADVQERQKDLAVTRGESDWYNVNILVVCDNEMYSRYSNWVLRAQSVVSDVNAAISYDDIRVQLVPTYDASKRYDLSNNFNAASPLQVFQQYVNNAYLNSKSADIAMYLSGNQFSTCIGASYGFDAGSTIGRHSVMMYETATGGGYGANPQERANLFAHEVGHLFDADHQTASSQTELYNRATTYRISGIDYHTLMYSYITTDPTYYSSDDLHGTIYHGDSLHNNAQRLRETKAIVAGYY